ncbi:conserved hypothetical protein [Paraburkholderia tropica]|uniref:hypothetical protein n=1 Tax=Paraburkholderia tropica TaxID=92647 RepID=UPI001CB3C923|nr:hypothetical protein [Paraburkholderia tropica]CAG9207675.1 conserved hypothetical protein [Paraburkholderia tropica]
MTASAVIAASVAAANAGTAKAGITVLTVIITAGASFAGAALAAWMSLRIAGQRMQHERRQEAVKRAFDSAGSHMAVVAFDKYVQFCEEYTDLFRETLRGLIQTGPHENALNYAADLSRLRTRWALWVTDEVNALLEKFEKALRQMGSDAHLSAPKLAASVPNRPEIINRMYKAFSDLFELGNWNGEEANKDLAVAKMMSLLKETLGIEQFSLLRQMTLNSALRELSEPENDKKRSAPIAA